MLDFRLVYALSTPSTMLPPIFVIFCITSIFFIIISLFFINAYLPTYLFQPTDLSLPTYVYLALSITLSIILLYMSPYLPMVNYLHQHTYAYL